MTSAPTELTVSDPPGASHPKAGPPDGDSDKRNTAERYLVILANAFDCKLPFGPETSWSRLQHAYRILEMPDSNDDTEFNRTWQAQGPGYPFYEQYLIHSDQVQTVVSNKALVEEDSGLNLADPWDLRYYRHVSQDPDSAELLRSESKNQEGAASDPASAELLQAEWKKHQEAAASDPALAEILQAESKKNQNGATSDGLLLTESKKDQNGAASDWLHRVGSKKDQEEAASDGLLQAESKKNQEGAASDAHLWCGLRITKFGSNVNIAVLAWVGVAVAVLLHLLGYYTTLGVLLIGFIVMVVSL
ncbi:MAG: hypothetical protein Q9168_004032 [Polycauliona sp. 1 TL-2023]